MKIREGGKGSGNFGHTGQIGKKGGSVDRFGQNSPAEKSPEQSDPSQKLFTFAFEVMKGKPNSSLSDIQKLQAIILGGVPQNKGQLLKELAALLSISRRLTPDSPSPRDPVRKLNTALVLAIRNVVKYGRIYPEDNYGVFNKDPFERRAKRLGVKY